MNIKITDSEGNKTNTTLDEMRASKQLRMDGEGFGPIRTNFNQARIDEKLRGHKKQVIESVEMKGLAEQVIEERGLDIGPASVACLLIFPNLSAKRAGKISKSNDLLLQVDPVFKPKDQAWEMKLRKPEFSDFYQINDKHGNRWVKA